MAALSNPRAANSDAKAAATSATAVLHFLAYPRLRENIWELTPGESTAYVETLDSLFEVSADQATSFMRVRSHCTGHNSIEEIAHRSGVALENVKACIHSLWAADMLVPSSPMSAEDVNVDSARQKLKRIGEIWGRELTRNFVANELLDPSLSKDVFIGWLLEMYHYVKDFPEAIAHGGRYARGELAGIYRRYVEEERGHEKFVLGALMNLGLGRSEVEASNPLVSTRLVGFLMRELFQFEPATVLLVASIIEAHETPEDQIETFQRELERKFGLSRGAMAPYFEHQRIDVALGHSKLLEDNLELFSVAEPGALDRIVDKMHDLKHAFELQSSEIKSYYGNLSGMYFPRQPMTFSAL